MGLRDDLLRAVLEWFKAAAVPVGAAPLTDDQVRRSDQKGRPPLPNATVKLTTFNVPRGRDEEIHGIDGGSGDPTVKIQGERSSVVSIQTFGDAGADWLESAGLRLAHESIKAINKANGITVNVIGGTLDLSALIDTSIEPRFVRDFQIVYLVESLPEASPEAATTETAYTQEGPTGDLVITIIEPPP